MATIAEFETKFVEGCAARGCVLVEQAPATEYMLSFALEQMDDKTIEAAIEQAVHTMQGRGVNAYTHLRIVPIQKGAAVAFGVNAP